MWAVLDVSCDFRLLSLIHPNFCFVIYKIMLHWTKLWQEVYLTIKACDITVLTWHIAFCVYINLQFNQVHGVLLRFTQYYSWNSCQEYIIKDHEACHSNFGIPAALHDENTSYWWYKAWVSMNIFSYDQEKCVLIYKSYRPSYLE